MDKSYTAQEMREEAIIFEARGGSSNIAAMLHQAADAIEREARRKMKYEYTERYMNGCLSAYVSRSLVAARACMLQFSTILRREVGEWEEVKE